MSNNVIKSQSKIKNIDSLIYCLVKSKGNFLLARMDVKRQFCKIWESLKFRGPSNTFFTSIWWYMKIGLISGQTPLKLVSHGTLIEVRQTNFALIYFLSLFVVNASLVVYSHLTMSHDHTVGKNPVILRVTYLQIISISVTAVVGLVNTFLMRKNAAKVSIFKSFLLQRLFSNQLQLFTQINNFGIKLNIYGVKFPFEKSDKKTWFEAAVLVTSILATDLAVCAVIHPFGKSLWDHLKCLLVNCSLFNFKF